MPESPRYGAQTKARKAALDVLYAAELQSVSIPQAFEDWQDRDGLTVREFTTTLVQGVAAHQAELDSKIENAGDWSLDRMPVVDRNLARIAVFELTHTQTPPPAVIAEAVRLGGDLSTDDSASFLNGLLAKVFAEIPATTD